MDPLLLALMACSDPPPAQVATPEPDAPAIDPSPWDYATTGAGPAPLDLERMGRALDAAVVEILTYDAEPLVEAYQAIHASADGTCPNETLDPYGNSYWADDCTALDGTLFSGYLCDHRFILSNRQHRIDRRHEPDRRAVQLVE